MFDEDLPQKNTGEFPRNLEAMSVSDLQDYITDLENEITRVKVDVEQKKASQDAASSVFKF